MLLKKRPKAIVFDFNGTLIDDLHVAYGGVKKIFETYFLPCPTLEQYRKEITADFLSFYFKHVFSKPTAKCELEKLRDHLRAIRKNFYKANEDDAHVRADVSRMVNWLGARSFYVAIVSGEIRTTLYRYLIKEGLQRQFDCIMAEAWGVGAKEKALLDVADIFRIFPKDMIYVDDTVDGLSAARNAGVVPVAFTNPTGYNSRERLLRVADLNINEIHELKELIKV